MSRHPLLALLAPFLALFGAAAARAEEPSVIERDTLDIAPHATVRIRRVDIENRLGDVRVIGHDAPGISLTVVKRAPDEETLERLKVNLLPDPSGTVSIGSVLLFGREARPIAAGSVRIDITVAVPRGAEIAVRGWNGRLDVVGVRAGARLLTHAGDITVTDVRGLVSTMSGRGRQRLRSVVGDVVADATQGTLELDEITGDQLSARLHRGTISATRIRSRTVQIRTTFGRILFQGTLLSGGRYEIRSYRGDVEVRFPRNATVRLDAYSREGEIEPRLELAEAGRPEAGRLRGTFGPVRARPAVLEVTSVAGNVTVGLLNE